MSHKWYLYIGEYKENYSFDQDIDMQTSKTVNI